MYFLEYLTTTRLRATFLGLSKHNKLTLRFSLSFRISILSPDRPGKTFSTFYSGNHAVGAERNSATYKQQRRV